jgi:hypothetical protein
VTIEELMGVAFSLRNGRGFGLGEARHRKYKRLKLDGGQAYDRSAE